MCRFLIVKTTHPKKPKELLVKFAEMAEASRAPDGDRQGDGWGITWLQNNTWCKKAYLNPVWLSNNDFSKFPATTLFLAHARSSSFKKDKGTIDFNQPYFNDDCAFVFNGLLEGVSFPRLLKGDIGAQRIWNLFQEHNENNAVEKALEYTINELNQYTKTVKALNLGLSDGKRIMVYHQFSSYPDYYTLQKHQSDAGIVICSEKLKGLEFLPLQAKKIHTFS